MKNINPFLLATGLVFLVCGYAWAGGSIEFLGNFSGGNVGAPTVFTGDNASGTGTVRIRPSDEDTQLVLCEAGNNSSPEVCSSVQHYNQAVTSGSLIFGSNIYLDNTSAYQRYNTSFGSGYIQTVASSTLGSNGVYWGVYNTSGTIAGYNTTLATGASTATNTFGVSGTVTNDFRGPITNGGSATCNGTGAGYACINDSAIFYDSSGTYTAHFGSSAASSSTQLWEYTQGTAGQATTLFATGTMASPTVVGAVGYYGSTYSDADYADKMTVQSVGKLVSISRNDDVNATTPTAEFFDNGSGTATRQLGIYGGGTIAFPQTQTVTCADNGGGTNATQNLDPQAHTITILNNDATGCDVTMQETSAILGAVAVICVDPASTATNVNLADVANVFNGAAPALGQGDCITIRYFDAANDLWLQTGASNN